MNREQWLQELLTRLRSWFDEAARPLPENISVAVGWPRSRGGKSRAVGQCFDPVWTNDGTCQIFICPTVGDPVRVADILLHELCHAAVGTRVGHSGPFVKLIRHFGLVGKATSTRAEPGTELHSRLSELVADLGEYPHSAMRPVAGLGPKRPPGGGWVKFVSPKLGEGYILRVSPKSLANHGAPRDPLGDIMIEES